MEAPQREAHGIEHPVHPSRCSNRNSQIALFAVVPNPETRTTLKELKFKSTLRLGTSPPHDAIPALVNFLCQDQEMVETSVQDKLLQTLMKSATAHCRDPESCL